MKTGKKEKIRLKYKCNQLIDIASASQTKILFMLNTNND